MSEQKLYYIDPTEEDTAALLEMFWEFHDFRIKEILCSEKERNVDVYLEYNSHEICVLLRFCDVLRMNYIPTEDYEADWLFGTKLFIADNDTIVWISSDDAGTAKPYPNDITWIQSNKLYYAMVDSNNNPIDIPNHIQHQTWKVYNFKTKCYEESVHHFSLKPVQLV